MKCKYNIDEIKRLLNAYYDGNTSIEQEKLLCDFFATTTDIPAELESERQMFMALQSATKIDIDIPADLEQSLIAHIDNLERQETQNRRKWIKPFSIISVAASIIILIAIGLKFVNLNDKVVTHETILVSEIKNNIIDNKIDNTIKIEQQEPDLAEEATKIPQEAKTKKRVKRQRITKTNQLKSVSDEQIAYENTERALMMLSEKLNIAQKGINKTQSTINEVNNTITDII